MIPEVNIIIPTYNRLYILPRALESILSQNYDNLKIIVVDDGSTDGTGDYLNKLVHENRITVIKHDKNYGVTTAKNTGLDHISTSAKYFGIFDSDDVMLPNTLKELVDIFEKLDCSVSQVFGWCVDIESGQKIGKFDSKNNYVTYEAALSGNFKGEFWQLVRSDLLEGLRFDNRAIGGESIVWHSLLKKAPGFLTNTVVRYYDQSNLDRVSIPKFNTAICRGKMYVNFSYLEKFKNDLLAICPEQYGLLSLESAKWAKLSGENTIAFKLLIQSFFKTKFKVWSIVAIQFFLPKELIRLLKQKKYNHLYIIKQKKIQE